MDLLSRFFPLVLAISLAGTTLPASAAAPSLNVISTQTGSSRNTDTLVQFSELMSGSDAADTDGDTIQFVFKGNVNGTLKQLNGTALSTGATIAAGGTWRWTPPTNSTGLVDAFRVRALAGGQESGADITVRVNVATNNFQPSFNDGPNVTAAEDSVAQVRAGWATSIDPGNANEDGQVLTFVVTPANPALFSSGPQVDPVTGDLTFTPASNAYGTTNCTIKLTDNGVGNNESGLQNFTITLTPEADPPVLTGTIDESSQANAFSDNGSGENGVPSAFLDNFTITDVDDTDGDHDNQVVKVFIDTDGNDYGTLEYPASSFSSSVVGGYRVLTSWPMRPALATTELRKIKYTPKANYLPVGFYTFKARVELRDSDNTPFDSTPDDITLHLRSVNNPPNVTATRTAASFPETLQVQPFRLSVTDPDKNESFSVTIVETTATAQGVLATPASPMTGSAAQVASAMQNVSYTPTLLGSNRDATFKISVNDANGATEERNLTLSLTFVNIPPEIGGIATNLIRINDDTTVKPFTNVTISDGNVGQSLTVSLGLDDPEKGEFIPTGPFNGTASQVTDQLRLVVFKPASNRVPVNESETVQIIVTVNDHYAAPLVNSQTQVEVTSVNGAPELTWDGDEVFPAAASPALIDPNPLAKPFTKVGIKDEGDVVVTVSLDDPLKGELQNLGGFTPVSGSPGYYRFTGGFGAAQTALQGIEFVPSSAYLFPPGQPGRTDFTISARDATLNTTTRVLPVVLLVDARNFMVTSNLDNPTLPGTLRHAISVAQSNDTITFALPSYPAVIRLSAANGPLLLNKHLTFHGPGQDKLTITGDTNSNGVTDSSDVQILRIFADVKLKGLKLSRGFAVTGGAAFVGRAQPDSVPGSLALEDCAITNCLASQWGGAVDVDGGSLEVSRCLFEGNALGASSGLGGGAISLYTNKTCSIVNSTFAVNSQSAPTGYGGGAIYVENDTPDRLFQTTVTHCTFAGNTDASNKGSSLHSNVSNTRVRLTNSLFADFSARNLQVSGGGEIVSDGGNLSNDNTTTTLIQGGVPQQAVLLNKQSDKRSVVDPRLAPLAAVEGQTRGYRLLPDSPAIGSGVASSTAPAVDQRGVIRNSTIDTGALDAQALGKLIVHEIFAPETSDPHFIEFFNPRDQAAIDLNGYQIRIDGEVRHVFASSQVVKPGFGIILADSETLTPNPAHANTPVVKPSVRPTASLDLGRRGHIELLTPAAPVGGSKVVESVRYIAEFGSSFTPADTLPHDLESITLAPQFQGAAFVPHSLVQSPPNGGVLTGAAGDLTSPGADTDGTPFGEDNAYPIAVNDRLEVTEDELAILNVLANDLDADGSDEVLIVDVNTEISGVPPLTSKSTVASDGGAQVTIAPNTLPVRGSAIVFDPRTAFKSLPEGARVTDTFAYTVLDFGGGDIEGYAAGGGSTTLVSAPSHRLSNGAVVKISGAGAYDGSHTIIVGLGETDSFRIPVTFTTNPGPLARGRWQAAVSRIPSARDEALVEVSVLGRNDPPTPLADLVTTNEETILRIFGDPTYAGTGTSLDTDVLYPTPRQAAASGLLVNDSDPDTDDNPFSKLHVIGVCQANSVTGFTGTPGTAPVTVTAPAHGLASGATVLISGYGGHPSYNGYQLATVIDADTFTIPVTYVDNHAQKGLWASLNDSNRLATVSQHGAEVALEIRANRSQTNVVYNPRTSTHLNGLAVGESDTDRFYYAVEDTHGAVSLAQVTVTVAGVNDDPLPGDNPPSLVNLDSGVTGGLPLPQFLKDLEVLYLLPASPASGGVNATIRPPNGDPGEVVVINDLDKTHEDEVLLIASSKLLANDSDVDRTNLLRVELAAGQNLSREGAAITLSPDGSLLSYNPTSAPKLQALAFKERVIDSFNVTIFDGTARVSSLVAVVVEGRNDQPQASNLTLTTPEKSLLEVKPPGLLLSGLEIDQNASLPDNRKFLLPVVASPTTVSGAKVDVVLERREGSFDGFGPVPGVSAATLVSATAHGLQTGEEVILRDGSLAGLYRVTRIGADSFSIPLTYQVDFGTLPGGTWDVLASTFKYDPRASIFSGPSGTPNFTLQGLGEGQEYNDTFTYTLVDGSFLFANDDIFRIEADRSNIELKVLANDRIRDGLATGRRIIAVGPPNAGGSVTVNAQESLIYTPETGFVGDEVFTYTIEDSLGHRDTALVTARVTVDRLNGNLRANADRFTVAKGESPLLHVLANDNIIPATGTPLTLVAVSTDPDHGGHAVVENGRVRYTPSASAVTFPYTETFGYTMSGGGSANATATVSVTVVDRTGKLNVRADSFGVPAGSSGTTLNVLENDNILPGNGENLEIVSVSNPLHGTVTITDGVALSYAPDPGFLGNDSFSYSVRDGVGGTGTAQVNVRVGHVTTNSDIFSVRYDDPSKVDDNGITELDVLANDNVIQGAGGQLTITAVTPAAAELGTMSISPGGGSLRFDPAAGETDQQDFVYTVVDGGGRTATGTVTVVVVASGIRASSDYFTVQTGSESTELVVLTNDIRISDIPGELSISAIGTGPNAPDQGGMVEISSDYKRIVYTAPSGFQGVESFTYTVTDGDSSDTARVSVRSTAGDMVAAEDAFLVFRGSSSNRLAVLTNDRIIPDAGQLLAITAVGDDLANSSNPPQRGTLEIIEEGAALLYTPSAQNTNYPYVETFTYDITAGGTDRAEGLIRIEVLDRVGARNLETNHDVFAVRSDSGGTLLPVLANDSVLPATANGWTITEVTPPTANVCSPFLMGDFLQPATLASRLAAQASPLAQYLWSRIQPAQRTVLANASAPELDKRIALVTAFNEIVKGGSPIYDATRFSGVTLRSQTQSLLDLGATGEQLVVLNRLLLEDAYPLDIRQASGGGSVQISGSNLVYAPQPGFVGTERFTYRVSDGFGGTGFAEVIVRVGDISVSDDFYVAVAGAGVMSLDVTANDGVLRTAFPATQAPAQADLTLAPGKPVTVFPPVTAGSASVDGSVVKFTPAAAFSGKATLTYWVQDDSGCLFSGTAIVEVLKPGDDQRSAVATIKVTGVNDAPQLIGATTTQVTDKSTTRPFANATVIEYDEQRQQIVRLTITYPADRGTLSGNFTVISPGVVELSGTAAQVTAELRALVYTPFENRINVPQPENTVFSVAMDDDFVSTPVVVNSGVAQVTPVNDAPVIHGTVGNQKLYQRSTLRPFAGVNVTDVDNLGLQNLTVSIQIDGGQKGFFSNRPGFTADTGTGLYQISGNPAAVSAALRGLVFEPTPADRVTPTAPELSSFTVTILDGFASPVVDAVTSVLVLHGEVDRVLPLGLAGVDASQAAAAFGTSVAVHGDTMVVGSPMRDGSVADAGRIDIYERNAGFGAPWGHVAQIVGSDSLAGDHFGQSVAIEGNVIVVGAPDARSGGSARTGAIYIFNRSSSDPLAWAQVAKLAPTVANPSGGDLFGQSVAIQGDTILAGAPLSHRPSGADRAGRVFTFRRGATPAIWTPAQTLVAAVTRASGAAGDSEFFGYSVALDGNTAVIGAPGANRTSGVAISGWNYGSAYVFNRSSTATDWSEFKVFEEFEKPTGANYAGFGYAVDISGDRVVVAVRSVGTPVGVTREGSARIFERNQGGTNQWGEVQQIYPSDAVPSPQYASSVAIDGDLLMIGTPARAQTTPESRGFVELYRRQANLTPPWLIIDRFAPGLPTAADRFGDAIALDRFTAVVGSSADGVNATSAVGAGSAKVYQFQYDQGPRLTRAVPDQVAVLNTPFSFTLDASTFDDPNYAGNLTWGIQREDGNPLPIGAWLSFNPATRSFSGTPVAGNSSPYLLVLHASNPLGTRIISNVFRIGLAVDTSPLATAYGAWTSGRFTPTQLANPALESSVWGMSADPDGDGHENVLEMLFGTNPGVGTPTPMIFQRIDSTTVSLKFPITSAFPADLAKVEWSDGLGTWSRLGVVMSKSDLPGDTDQMTATITLPAPRAKVFVRVVVNP